MLKDTWFARGEIGPTMFGFDGLLEIVAKFPFGGYFYFFIIDELPLFDFESFSRLDFKGFLCFLADCSGEPRLVLWNMLELWPETCFLWILMSRLGL